MHWYNFSTGQKNFCRKKKQKKKQSRQTLHESSINLQYKRAEVSISPISK